MEHKFDAPLHDQLISILSKSRYVEDCVEFSGRYKVAGDIDGPKLNLNQTKQIFVTNGIACTLDRRFKVFLFDVENIHGWTWEGSLVVKRYGMLEPMMAGASQSTGRSVGSTLMHIAGDVAKLNNEYDKMWRQLNRPYYDGDMRTMERMIPDLVHLFRAMKDTIRRGWATDDPAVSLP